MINPQHTKGAPAETGVPQPTGTVRPTHGYCPECKEECPVDGALNCLWCETSTRQGAGKKRGKPQGVYGNLSDSHLRALHEFHLRGVSIRELGRRIWEKAGYSSPKSAAQSISDGFKRLGLAAEDRAKAVRRANEKRRDADSPGTADRTVYKRYLRTKAGGQRRCQGVKLNAPGKGKRCCRWAPRDSDFCRFHDPARRTEVVARVDEMRARIGVAA